MNRYRHLPTYRYYDIEGCPLTLGKSVGKYLRNYKIYGDSVQYGTPTPDTPIEVESVGDKTSNLFDNDINVSNIVKDGNDLLLKSYACGTGIKPSKFLEMTGLKVGDTFTIKRTFTVEKGTPSTATGAIRFLTSSSVFFRIIDGSQDINTVTITEDFNDDNYTSLYFYGVSTAENGERLVKFSNVQIVKGSYTEETMPAYEPYGYKIPIKVGGSNKLNPDNYGNYLRDGGTYKDVTFVRNSNGSVTINGTASGDFTLAVSTDNGFVDDKEVYTLCGCYGGSATTYYLQTQNGYRDIGNGVKLTATIDKNIIRFYIKSGAVFDNVTICPMLIKGDYVGQNIAFEPYIEPFSSNIYLKEPLRKGGNYADYIYFVNKKIIRNIAYKKITSSLITGKSSASTENFNYYFITFSDAMVGRDIPILSNIGGHKLSELNSKQYEGIFSNSNTTFFIAFFDITTLADARQFVTDNEVYVNYILATPTEETIELPTIPTHKGTTIIEIDTSVLPSNMEVQYYK